MSTACAPAAGLLRAWDAAALLALACYGFFAPFSSAGVSISGVALVALALARPRLLAAARPWREPVFAIGLALLLWIALHTLAVTGADAVGGSTINHYHELLLAPLLYALVLERRRRRVLLLGLTAGLATLAAAYWLFRLAPALVPALPERLHARRISAGFVLAIGAFLWLMHSRQAARPWTARAIAAAFATTVLFAIEGRTGHVVLLALAAIAAWQFAPRRWRLPMAIGLPALLLVVALLGSDVVRSRLSEIGAVEHAAPAAAVQTSTGIRIELARLALDLSRDYGLGGAGFANYAHVHEQAAQARYAGDPARAGYLKEPWIHTPNPHNEYFMQLLGGGIVSLLLYLAWLAATWKRGTRFAGPVGAMLAGSALAFAVGSLFNSLLLDFIEAHVYAGLLACLVAATRRSPADADPRRVLVIVTRQIGDVLLTTPLVRAVKARWPRCRIEVLGFQGTLGMLEGNGDIDGTIEIPPRAGWRATLALVRRLWRHHDLALVADAGDRAHLIGWLAAPLRTGLVPAQGRSNWLKRRLLSHAVDVAGDRGSVHVVTEKLELLAPWSKAAGGVPRVIAPRAAPLPPDIGDRIEPGAVVIHAPSMWDYKQWPVQHFAAVAARLLADGRQVVLTGSASARDRDCVARLLPLGAPPKLLDVSGRLSFAQLVALFDRAALYIGPDTSVSHLAAACGLPVVAVFGPTNPRRWAPWPRTAAGPIAWSARGPLQRIGNVTIVQSELPCVPCGFAGCENHQRSRSDCLVAITPQRVFEAAMAMLDPSPAARQSA